MRDNRNHFTRHFVVWALTVVMASPLPSMAQSQGQSSLPVLGDPATESLSPVSEQRLGDRIWQVLQRSGDALDDPDLTDYLRSLQRQLVQAAKAEGLTDETARFRFFPVRDLAINAFALPGGYIGVHTGLIARVGDEAQLISVLSHELGHVTQRHLARMVGEQKQASLAMLATMAVALLAAGASGDGALAAASLGQTVAVQNQMAFSRDAEREADRIGLLVMTRAGYEPSAMSAMFQLLQRSFRVYESASAPNYLRSHPLTVDRIADVEGRIQQLAPSKFTVGARDFPLIRAHAASLGPPPVDGLNVWRQRFEAQAETKGLSNQEVAAAWYAAARVALAQRDPGLTVDLVNRARAAWGAPHPFFSRTAIAAAAIRGDKALALSISRDAISAFPSSEGLARDYVQALLANDRAEEAVRFQRGRIRERADDPAAWDLMAQAYAKAEQLSLQHMANAERYALLGATRAAIEQLEMAQKGKDLDHVNGSVIDSRLAALRRQRKEEIEEERNAR